MPTGSQKLILISSMLKGVVNLTNVFNSPVQLYVVPVTIPSNSSLGNWSIEFCSIHYLGNNIFSLFTVQRTFVCRSGHLDGHPQDAAMGWTRTIFSWPDFGLKPWARLLSVSLFLLTFPVPSSFSGLSWMEADAVGIPLLTASGWTARQAGRQCMPQSYSTFIGCNFFLVCCLLALVRPLDSGQTLRHRSWESSPSAEQLQFHMANWTKLTEQFVNWRSGYWTATCSTIFCTGQLDKWQLDWYLLNKIGFNQQIVNCQVVQLLLCISSKLPLCDMSIYY